MSKPRPAWGRGVLLKIIQIIVVGVTGRIQVGLARHWAGSHLPLRG